jgi:hypothetical protein
MSVEVALATLKFVAVLITGLFAVIALQVDYKDKEGRITKWGRRALIGSVVSTLVAIGAQALETTVKHREEAASAEGTQKLLTEIRRAVYRIQNVYVTANVVVPRDTLRSYASRIDKTSAAIAKGTLNDPHANVDTDISTNRTTNVAFYKASKLYPEHGSLEWQLLVDVGLEFRFYKKPIDLNSIRQEFVLPQADLEFVVRPTETEIEYKPRRGFQAVAMNMEANARDVQWHSNGRIASLQDLDSAQLIVRMQGARSSDSIQSTIELLSVAIDIGGRRMFLGSGLAKVSKTEPNTRTYSFSFPKNLLEADEYLGQDKAANDKVRARATSYVLRWVY